ncbi:MAG: sugar ABC transporter permease [Ilumatobacteraceae bacterium]|nr:sugar ABC transporter permease [Ilumatobacteraceae bacterium]
MFAFVPLSIFTLVLIVPFVRGIYFTFRDWDGFGSTKWVGFDNYVAVFHDDKFWHSLWLTLGYVLATVVITNLVAFGLALLVTMPMRGMHALRTVFFVPNLIGGVILGLVWQFLFSKVIPQLPFFSSNWLLETNKAFWALVIVTVWQMSGYMMIVYVTALMSVNPEVLEASTIDGATGFRQMLYIKIPLIAPAFTISLFLTMRNAFMAYDLNLALTNGNPYNSTELMSLHVYREAFTRLDFATGQAQAVVMFIVVAAAALVQVVISKRFEVQA